MNRYYTCCREKMKLWLRDCDTSLSQVNRQSTLSVSPCRWSWVAYVSRTRSWRIWRHGSAPWRRTRYAPCQLLCNIMRGRKGSSSESLWPLSCFSSLILSGQAGGRTGFLPPADGAVSGAAGPRSEDRLPAEAAAGGSGHHQSPDIPPVHCTFVCRSDVALA